jgi:uncharacterized protein YnzC (UPF0291/DUF896 family)
MKINSLKIKVTDAGVTTEEKISPAAWNLYLTAALLTTLCCILRATIIWKKHSQFKLSNKSKTVGLSPEEQKTQNALIADVGEPDDE